jgi:hypothetical protein
MNIEAALKEAMDIDGALGVSLVDWESGMALGSLARHNLKQIESQLTI